MGKKEHHRCSKSVTISKVCNTKKDEEEKRERDFVMAADVAFYPPRRNVSRNLSFEIHPSSKFS